MNFKKLFYMLGCFILCFICVACNTHSEKPNSDEKKESDFTNGEIFDNNEVEVTNPDTENHSFVLLSQTEGVLVYGCLDCNTEETVVISCVSGTENAYTVEDNIITFNKISENSVYDISGSLHGNIVIDIGDTYKFELQMSGFIIYSYTTSPITIWSGDKITLSAKKSTENYVYDMREAIDETTEPSISASIYALSDLDIQGKGTLNIKSINNNGIHTKDDLNVKNVTLQVDCKDNALKGNDSVTIESGNLVLIARQGDGIKTTNSDVSTKGKQRGTVTIMGGDILVYAACDGIDAAYDVDINESMGTVNLQIFTDKYSKYSEEVTAISDSVYYVRVNSTSYSYSLKFYNDENDAVWYNSSSYISIGNFRYYSIPKPNEFTYVQLYIYSTTQQQGQGEDYLVCTDGMTVNNNYDTIALKSSGSSFTYSWTNYTTTSHGNGGFGGMGGTPGGGMNEGNSDKGDYSTKGIKSANRIVISAGTVTVSSYDDAIHANNDTVLENSATPMGNITISGGDLTVRSNDDGIHADGKITIDGGNITVIGSYEGLEGNVIEITNGSISILSSDDGINGTSRSGTAILISGGNLYIFAGGDGVDSNSTTSYEGICFSGGTSVIISTGQSDSSIDTERGYKYLGGYVIGVGRSGGMGSEAVYCSNFSSVGTNKTISLQKDTYLVVKDMVIVKMPVSMNAMVVCLGKTNASLSSSTSTNHDLNANGIYWMV